MMGALGSSLAVDDLLDEKYRIVRFIGQGAWASVYEGVNVRIHRRVAIKVLGTNLSEQPEMLERFIREAQLATSIDSPNVVGVFDLGSLRDGRPYIVMELLEGEDLGRRLEQLGTLPPELAVYYTVQALQGLSDAHAAGVIHRDIKPNNVVIVKSKHGDEIVKIVDFGVSKLGELESQLHGAKSSMTQTNALLGSPVYMSPEQCRGARNMDRRSDLYSIGVVLFECIAGQPPHVAESFNELMFKIALEDAQDIRVFTPDLDPELAVIIAKSLARQPEHRFQDAGEFQNELIAWAERRGFEPKSWPSAHRKTRLLVDTGEALRASQRRRIQESISSTPPAGSNPPNLTASPILQNVPGATSNPPFVAARYPASAPRMPVAADVSAPPAAASSTAALTPMDASNESFAVAVRPNRKRSLVLVALAAAALSGAAVYGVIHRQNVTPTANAQPSVPATTAKVEATTQAPVTPPATAMPTPEPQVAPTVTQAAATAPSPHTPAGWPPTRPQGKAGTPPTGRATAQAATPTASTPAATGTAKATVEGRTIRTTLE